MKTYKLAKPLNYPGYPEWDRKISGKFKETKDFWIGVTCVVLKPGVVKDYLPDIKVIGKSIVIKIFVYNKRDEDVFIINNIAHIYGISPKIYDVFKVVDGENEYLAVVAEYIDRDFLDTINSGDLWDIYKFILQYHDIYTTMSDGYMANFRGIKLVDFQPFHFRNKENYIKILEDRYKKIAYWGNGSSPYQEVEELGINGGRSYERFEKLGIKNMDLTGKTVLDIGCSGGQVLFWASSHGANRVIGLDTPEISRITYEMATVNKYFNIETIGLDLNEEIANYVRLKTGVKQFDYVFMFSMNAHIGFHQYMRDLCGDTLFLETNAAEMPEVEVVKYPEELKKLGYTEFEYKGQVDESGGRSLFICR